jgi:hypothetical protein
VAAALVKLEVVFNFASHPDPARPGPDAGERQGVHYVSGDQPASLTEARWNRIYVWQAGSEYAYTGSDSYHNGTIFVFLPGTSSGVNTAPHNQRGFDGQEFLGGVDPNNPDSDGDTILDGWDGPRNGSRNSWGEDRDGDGLVNALDTDSDGDGIPDGVEFSMGGESFMPELGATNPYEPDTDHDGISDRNDTHPLDYDNDLMTGYGAFNDSWGSWPAFGGREAAYFDNQLNRSLAWDNPDTDGDGVPDGVEDANHNGIKDANETNALDVDSDDDGLWDGPDVYNGTAIKLEAEAAANLSSGIAIQSGSGASGGNYTNWTGYLETSSWSFSAAAGYYRLELALADDSSPSNTSIQGRNVTVEVYLDAVLLNVSSLAVNSSVHLPTVQLAGVSPVPIWNTSTHVLNVTIVRGDEDYRFHLDYVRLVPYHPGEWNASAGALRNDSDGDGVHDGAERGLVQVIVQNDTSQMLGTNLSRFMFAPYLALSSAAANDSDGDGLPDGYRQVANTTVIEAESTSYANATVQTGGGVTTLKTNTSVMNTTTMAFTILLEAGYYELTGKVNRGPCQAPAGENCSSSPTFQTDLQLAGAFVGRNQFHLSDANWHDVLMGALVVRQRGVYEVKVLERYNRSYAYRFEVDYFTLTHFSIGERWLGLNPSDPDTDRDLVTDGTEFLRMTDPLKVDTDGDGIPDSQEAPFLGDFDGSTWNESASGFLNSTDAHSIDRDHDNWTDSDVNESSVVFRTNATRGMYNESDVWVAVDLNGTGTLTSFRYDAAVAINYSNAAAVVFWTRLGGNVSRNATTPEGYPLFKNGSWVFIDLPGSIDVRFVAASGAPIPAEATNATRNLTYLAAFRESLNWSAMLNQDPDDDGLIGADDPCPWVFDCDGDHIGDGEERAKGTDPQKVDSDGDGLWDGPTVGIHIGEWANHTDPLMNDTDLDGLWDGWNITVSGTFHPGELNYSTDPTEWDTDGDGMPDLWEIVNGLNATNATDGWLDLDHDGLPNVLEYQFGRPDQWEQSFGSWGNGTNVSYWDSDHDGLPDGWEFDHGLDPLNASDRFTDYDLDGLNATYEYRLGRPSNWNEAAQGPYWGGSNPAMADTDSDGIPDGYEEMAPSIDVDGDGRNNWNDTDSDGDGLNDSVEAAGWYVTIIADDGWWGFTGLDRSSMEIRHVTSDPYSAADRDGDGLNDSAEYANLTDPARKDSDFDGIPDQLDSHPHVPELEPPIFQAVGDRIGVDVTWDVDCGGDEACQGAKSSDFWSSVGFKIGMGLTWPRTLWEAATKWTWIVNVSVSVSDNAGIATIRVDAMNLQMNVTRPYVTDPAMDNPWPMVNDVFTFRLDMTRTLVAGSLERWQVTVVDRNGNAAITGQTGGKLYNSEKNELGLMGPLLNGTDGYDLGMFEGVKEGLWMTAVGMAWGAANFAEWVGTNEQRGKVGAAAAGFIQMTVQFGLNPVGAIDGAAMATALSDSLDLNPYSPDAQDVSVLVEMVNEDSVDPMKRHLTNATVDHFCTLIHVDACQTPHDTSNWARFIAGHAVFTAATEYAMFVIFLVGMVDAMGGEVGGLVDSVRSGADLPGSAGLARAIQFFDRARAALARADPAVLDAMPEGGALAENVEMGLASTQKDVFVQSKAWARAEAVGGEDGAFRVFYLLSKYDPLGILEGEGTEAAPFDVIGERGAVFDALARLSGRVDDVALRNVLRLAEGREGMLVDGVLAASRSDMVVDVAQFYADAFDGGADPSILAALIKGGLAGRLSPGLEYFDFGEESRNFEIVKFQDSQGRQVGYLVETVANGERRLLGPMSDADQGYTYDRMKGLRDGTGESRGQWDGLRHEVLRWSQAWETVKAMGGNPVKVVRLATDYRGTFDYGFVRADDPSILEGVLEVGKHDLGDFGGKLARTLRQRASTGQQFSPDWASGELLVYGDKISEFTGLLTRDQARSFVDGFEDWARARQSPEGGSYDDLGIHAHAETQGGTTIIWLELVTSGAKVQVPFLKFPPGSL